MVNETMKKIEDLDEAAMREARKRWDDIAKPLHSLGKLEDVIVEMAGIYGTSVFKVHKKALIVMCADNGVVEEGVTQTGQEVTAIVAENFLDEKSCVAIMCKDTDTDIFPIDIGMVVDTKRVEKRKIAYGTKNMVKGPAMTRQEAVRAIETGIELVFELKKKGYDILAAGEMGIGNTTTSSAITSLLLDLPVETVAGRGAGLSKEGLNRKIHAISKAIEVNQPDPDDVVDVLAKVGGFDIAGLVGVYLGAAAAKLPVILDGFISATAALVAIRMEPKAAPYLIASHVSAEPAGQLLLDAIKKEPFLTCKMCLGEGSGAVALFPLLEMANDIYLKMGTFEENQIEAYVPLD